MQSSQRRPALRVNLNLGLWPQTVQFELGHLKVSADHHVRDVGLANSEPKSGQAYISDMGGQAYISHVTTKKKLLGRVMVHRGGAVTHRAGQVSSVKNSPVFSTIKVELQPERGWGNSGEHGGATGGRAGASHTRPAEAKT